MTDATSPNDSRRTGAAATTLATGPARQGLYDPSREHDACGVAFVADIHGRPSRDIVDKAIQALVNIDHRGAAGAEKNTGDGAGILMQIPDAFYRAELSHAGVLLPEPGAYATGIAFLPQARMATLDAIRAVEDICAEEGVDLITWRDVPVGDSALGSMARDAMPVFRQIFVSAKGRDGRPLTGIGLDRKVWFVRKRCERELGDRGAGQGAGGDEEHAALAEHVAQAPHHRDGDGADEQRRRQEPGGVARRGADVLLDRAHHRHDHRLGDGDDDAAERDDGERRDLARLPAVVVGVRGGGGGGSGGGPAGHGGRLSAFRRPAGSGGHPCSPTRTGRS